ncbi:MAG: hypothetical protein ACJ739_04305 [Acidimicrobiales bacterium]
MPPEPRPATGGTRRLSSAERHHLEIVELALGGDVARASALAREHLVEHPDDAEVARLLAGWEPQ